jgi:predicted homoserine dehydrogenase-like protein
MPGLNERLRALEAAGKPIRVAMTGAGWMGGGFLNATALMPGLEVAVVVNDDVNVALATCLAGGHFRRGLRVAESVGEAADALRAGKRVVTASQDLAAQLELVDILVDVTPSPATGARTAMSAIEHGKDVVLVNIEADATVGCILHHLAQQAGVLYTVSSGDEPGCIQELYEFTDALGYEVVAVGKGKNNPLDRSATPETMAEAAARQGKDPAQVASYVDGTKTMFEMCCASNALGFPPDVPGMHGPPADRNNITEWMALAEDGGLLSQPGVVDYVTGPEMAGGVWIVAWVGHETIIEDLRYLKVGQGPYFCFFRPYHLWFLEAGLSVARAHLLRQPTLVPQAVPTSEVLAIAKCDLAPGERLDGVGGYTYYGWLDRAERARELNALPLGLAEGALVQQKVEQGTIITYEDVILDEDSLLVRLRRRQEAL